MTENQINNQYNDEQEIDIMEMISKLWKRRSMIIKWCIVGAVIGLIAGFSIPKTYTAGVTLAPELQQRTSSGVSSIASMMGVNLNNSVDAASTLALAQYRLKNKDFRDKGEKKALKADVKNMKKLIKANDQDLNWSIKKIQKRA